VRREVRLEAVGELVLLTEPARVVRVELHRAIVTGLDVDRRARVRETVLAFVRLGERDEQLGGVRALLARHGFARLDAVEHARRVLLLERGIGAVDLARRGERARGTLQIAGELSGRRFVAEETDASSGILLDLELR